MHCFCNVGCKWSSYSDSITWLQFTVCRHFYCDIFYGCCNSELGIWGIRLVISFCGRWPELVHSRQTHTLHHVLSAKQRQNTDYRGSFVSSDCIPFFTVSIIWLLELWLASTNLCSSGHWEKHVWRYAASCFCWLLPSRTRRSFCQYHFGYWASQCVGFLARRCIPICIRSCHNHKCYFGNSWVPESKRIIYIWTREIRATAIIWGFCHNLIMTLGNMNTTSGSYLYYSIINVTSNQVEPHDISYSYAGDRNVFVTNEDFLHTGIDW